jgi:DNA-binding NarL/FixJ family response regulator
MRVVVVEDHPMYGEGVRATLEGAGGIAVVALARTAAEGLEAVRLLQPDVAVVDIGLPDASGLSVVAALRDLCRVLVLTSSDDDATVFAALRSGAIGYLTKTADADDLVRAVRTVAAGDGVLSATVLDRVVRPTTPRRHEGPFPALTAREHEVLELVADGHSNAYIADRFVLSLKTVRNHVSAVMAKIGAATRAEAVAMARDAGLGGSEQLRSRNGTTSGGTSPSRGS